MKREKENEKINSFLQFKILKKNKHSFLEISVKLNLIIIINVIISVRINNQEREKKILSQVKNVIIICLLRLKLILPI